MVEKIRCDHCGAECKRAVTKVIDGRQLTFCCSGCLQVYELLQGEGPQSDQGKHAMQEQTQAARRPDAQPEAGSGPTIRTVQLPILGMTSANCVAQVERGLRGVPGVSHVSVSLTKEQATVQFDSRKTSIDGMAAAVRSRWLRRGSGRGNRSDQLPGVRRFLAGG